MRLARNFSILLLSLFLLTACFEKSPESVVNEYLQAASTGNHSQAYEYLSAEDKVHITRDEYTEKAAEKNLAWLKTSFQVKKIDKPSSDSATATVDITGPDIRPLLGEMMKAAFASAFSKDKEKASQDMQNQLAEKIKNEDLPTITKTEEFALVKEADGWKISLGLAKQDRIKTLMEEAKNLTEQKKLHGAQEKYEEVLELDSKMVEAQTGLKDMQDAIVSHEEKQQYIDKIELYDLKSKYYNTYSGKVSGVSFKLKNKGDRTLNEVEVTVYFQDAEGNTIHEEDYHPVLVSRYSFSGDNKPLKPNYIWQMERDKFYQAESVPNEWKEGKVTARITDIEFADQTEEKSNQKTEQSKDSQSTKTAKAKAPESFDLAETEKQIQKNLQKCWNIPAGAKGAHDLAIELALELDKEGTILSATVADTDKAKYHSDVFYRAAADSATRAANRCSRFQGWTKRTMRSGKAYL